MSEHNALDVVQTERIFLKKNISNEQTEFSEVAMQKDTYVPEGGYWENFYRTTDHKDWNELAYCWKYVCTYGLSLKTKVFKDMGWFKKNYIFYGFEDTDLGYRLAKRGFRFYRSRLKCLHLFHETQRSEFSNSDYLRHQLLKKTAKIFFHNQLHPEIFEHFRSLVDDGTTVRGTLVKLKKKLFSRQPD